MLQLPLDIVCGVMRGRARRKKTRNVFVFQVVASSQVAAFVASNPYVYLANEPGSSCRYLELPPDDNEDVPPQRLVLERWQIYNSDFQLYYGFVDCVGLQYVHDAHADPHLIYRDHCGCGLHMNFMDYQRITWYREPHGGRNLVLRDERSFP